MPSLKDTGPIEGMQQTIGPVEGGWVAYLAFGGSLTSQAQGYLFLLPCPVVTGPGLGQVPTPQLET